MVINRIEDVVSAKGFSDYSVSLVGATYVGHQALLAVASNDEDFHNIKADGSTYGAYDIASGAAIANYINSNPLDDVQFCSEEGMDFYTSNNAHFWGVFDDLDGSINSFIGSLNRSFIGVGGVIHDENDVQVSAAASLPFTSLHSIFFAERGLGTHRLLLEDPPTIVPIRRTSRNASKSTLIESGFMTESTLNAERALQEAGFYQVLGTTTRDKVTGGIYQTVSELVSNRQVVLNLAPSHQADYCYLLLTEAGSEVWGQNGGPMYSTSYAMLSLAPSFSGDRTRIKEAYVEALSSSIVQGMYRGWNPGHVVLMPVYDRCKNG